MDVYEIETECDYSLTIKFPTPDKLTLFWSIFEEFLLYRQVHHKKPKCENDRREQHVRILHQKTREFLAVTPEIPYRVAYKIVASEMKLLQDELLRLSEYNIT